MSRFRHHMLRVRIFSRLISCESANEANRKDEVLRYPSRVDADGPRLRRRIQKKYKRQQQQEEQTKQMDSVRLRIKNLHGFHSMECGELSSHSKRSRRKKSHSIHVTRTQKRISTVNKLTTTTKESLRRHRMFNRSN